MKILITGISGRIGSHLARILLEAGHQIRGLIWPRDSARQRLAGLDLDLLEGSLTDPTIIDKAVAGVAAIYHLGAAFQAGGPFSNEDYFRINVGGTFNILEAARRSDHLRHLFFASSDALYDKYIPSGMSEPISEDKTPLAPRGMYPLTKSLAEDLCLGYQRTYNLPLTVFRFALVVAGTEILNFGQFYCSHWLQAYRNRSDAPGQAVYQQLQAALTDPEPLLLARDEAGRSYKKHIADVRDIIQGLQLALERPGLAGQVIQLAAPRPFTWAEVIPYLAEKLGRDYIDIRLAGQIPIYYEFDLSKSRQLLGYQPRFDIFKMIDAALAERTGPSVNRNR